jgi:hypothetical protein
MATIQLKKFRPDKQIAECASMLVVGGRRTGKSMLMRDLLWHMRDRIYDARVYTGTMEDEESWDNYTPAKYVTFCQEALPEEDLNAALRLQDERKKIAKLHGIKCPPSLFLFEDCEFLKPSIWSSQPVKSLALNGRHRRTFLMAAVQYLISARSEIRGMWDLAFFCFEPMTNNRERVFKNFGGMCGSFAEFDSIFCAATRDWGVLVIDCRAKSYKLQDCLFWYRAKDVGKYRLGVPDVWKATPPPKATTDDDDLDRILKRRRAAKNKRGDWGCGVDFVELVGDEKASPAPSSGNQPKKKKSRREEEERDAEEEEDEEEKEATGEEEDEEQYD